MLHSIYDQFPPPRRCTPSSTGLVGALTEKPATVADYLGPCRHPRLRRVPTEVRRQIWSYEALRTLLTIDNSLSSVGGGKNDHGADEVILASFGYVFPEVFDLRVRPLIRSLEPEGTRRK